MKQHYTVFRSFNCKAVVVCVQRWDTWWPDGVRAVSHGLGHGAGQQLRRRRGEMRWTRQRLPGHQPAAQDPEETGRVRGTGSEGCDQVRAAGHSIRQFKIYIYIASYSKHQNSLLVPFEVF